MRRQGHGADRRPGRTVAVVALVLAAACSGGDDVATDDAPAPTIDPALASPGAPLGDSGLVVPGGAHLAGVVFGGPGVEPGGGWGALLTVDHDPFAVLDDVAGQVRADGTPMPGSRSACEWGVDTTGEGRADEWVPAARPDPEGEVVEVTCEATGRGPSTGAEGDLSIATASLGWGRGTTGAIWLTWSTRPSDQAARGSGSASGPGPSQPQPAPDEPVPAPFGPDPVPPSARDLLPDRAGPVAPEPGERFGAASDCHSGYARFRLPEGARLVAAQGGVDGRSVLAVERVRPGSTPWPRRPTPPTPSPPTSSSRSPRPTGRRWLAAGG